MREDKSATILISVLLNNLAPVHSHFLLNLVYPTSEFIICYFRLCAILKKEYSHIRQTSVGRYG